MNPSILLNEESAITIGDFLKLSENFEYSQEYFDLFKEGSEIELMEKYLDCQEFLMENNNLSAEDRSFLIMEAADEDKVKDLKEKLTQKKGTFWGKIKNGFLAALKAITSVFNRILNVFTNSQGKKIESLKKLADGLVDVVDDRAKINEQSQEQVAKHIGSLLRGKAHAVENFRIIVKNRDDEISKLNAKLARYKGVDPDLYKELQQVSAMLADNIEVELPETTSKVSDFTAELNTAIGAYQTVRGTHAGNKATHLSAARKIAELKHKIQESRTKKVKRVINPTWLKETHDDLVKNTNNIQEQMNAITSAINSTIDSTPDKKDTSKRNDIKNIRTSGEANFHELAMNLSGLLNNWMVVANESISSLKEFIDVRNHNIGIQSQILNDIARKAGKSTKSEDAA